MYGLAGLAGGDGGKKDVVSAGLKPSALMKPPSLRKPSAKPPPPPKPKMKKVAPPPLFQTPPPPTPSPAASSVDEKLSSRAVLAELELPNAYQPSNPNDYHAVCRKREIRKIREQALKRQENQKQHQLQQIREPQPRSEETPHHVHPDSGEAAFLRRAQISQPGPQTGEDAFKRRAQLSGGTQPAKTGEEAFKRRAQISDAPDETVENPYKRGRSGVAESMMARMGWKPGQGLGRDEQGIKNPLQHRRTGGRGGVIEEEFTSPAPPPATTKRVRSFRGVPSCVLLLQNMVGPGEVDGELEGEVAGECGKYGKVEGCLIFEVTDNSVSPEQAVRIFVCFSSTEAARKAYVDLDGRFFGGRNVVAAFFPKHRFDACDLAPGPDDPK